MSHSQTSEDLTHVLKPWLARIDTMRRAEDILATAGAMDRDGIRVMLHFTSDFRQSVASRIGVLRRDGLGLPEFSFYARTDAKAVSARRTYVQHVTNILQLLGEPAAAAEARKIMELEIRLGKFRLTDSAVREANASYNAMMREELLAFTPRIDWSVYFNTLGVNPPSIVNVETPPFVAALDTVLTSFPLSTWQAYFKLRLVDRMYPTLGERFVRQYENYSNQLNGIPPTQSRISQNEANRSHQCLQTVVELLPGAVGRLYATTKFSPTLEKRARDMFEHLKRAMEQRLKNVQWMSDSTKPKALAKLSTMTMRVIYPKDFRIDYTGLVLSSSSYVENVAAIRRFNRARELRNVGRSPDTSLWVGSPMQAGAYYAGRGVDSGKVIFNHIMVDAGLLAAPVFDTAADDASNYGALGAIIGHEITHAFDGNGRLQDKEGHPRDWWTPKESEEFTRRSRRLSDQYSKYILIDTFHVDGNLTVNENIADLGGVLVAYDAWEDAMAGKRRTPLEGLTPEQRFFVSFANVWRWNVRPDILRLFIWKDNHAIPRWRVNGVLPNVPGFAKAFGCKPGDTLAPPADQRIAIW